MCRTYESKEGLFTRLCYRTGRKGFRLPGDVVSQSGHYGPVAGGVRIGPPRSRAKYEGCITCQGPVSRHHKICALCEKGQ